MTEGSERAFAKVNLFLHVVGRRPDGYHLLDSLAAFARYPVPTTLELEDRTERLVTLYRLAPEGGGPARGDGETIS